MNKKAQITPFIIVGLVILILAVLVIVNTNMVSLGKTSIASQDINVQGLAVEQYVQSCLDKTAKEALVFIGSYGGYYELPQLSHEVFSLPYYWHIDTNYMISKAQLETEIAKYIDQETFFCLHNFKPFTDQGLVVEQGISQTTVTLKQNELMITTHFPVTIKQKRTQKTISEFSQTTPTRIGIVHDLITLFMNQQIQEPNEVCMSCLAKLAVQNNMKIQLTPMGEKDVLFTVIDEEVPVHGESYEFSFMNQYEFKTEEIV